MSEHKTIHIPITAKVYEFDPLVEICGNCCGSGKINITKLPADSLQLSICGDTCPVCFGSGRVVKEKTVIIDIKPYK